MSVFGEGSVLRVYVMVCTCPRMRTERICLLSAYCLLIPLYMGVLLRRYNALHLSERRQGSFMGECASDARGLSCQREGNGPCTPGREWVLYGSKVSLVLCPSMSYLFLHCVGPRANVRSSCWLCACMRERTRLWFWIAAKG